MYSAIVDNRARTIEINGESFDLVFFPQITNCPSSCPRCSHSLAFRVKTVPGVLMVIWNHEDFVLESVSRKMESQCIACKQRYGTMWESLNPEEFEHYFEHLNPIHLVHPLQIQARRLKLDSICNPANGVFLAGYQFDRPRMRNLEEFLNGFKGLENQLSANDRQTITDWVLNRKNANDGALEEELARAGL